jgi:hypothetical protein
VYTHFYNENGNFLIAISDSKSPIHHVYNSCNDQDSEECEYFDDDLQTINEPQKNSRIEVSEVVHLPSHFIVKRSSSMKLLVIELDETMKAIQFEMTEPYCDIREVLEASGYENSMTECFEFTQMFEAEFDFVVKLRDISNSKEDVIVDDFVIDNVALTVEVATEITDEEDEEKQVNENINNQENINPNESDDFIDPGGPDDQNKIPVKNEFEEIKAQLYKGNLMITTVPLKDRNDNCYLLRNRRSSKKLTQFKSGFELQWDDLFE